MKVWETHSGYSIVQLLAGRSNVFLVTNGKLNIVVDTSPARKWRMLKRRLAKLDVEKIDFLVLTHVHYDHVGNVLKVKEMFKAKIIVHQLEANLLSGAISQIPAGTNPITRFLVYSFGNLASSIARFDGCQPDILVDTLFSFEEYGLNAYLLQTHGHTVGSMSLIVDNELAIVGDTMFGIFPRSIFPPFANDVSAMIASWGKLLETNCNWFLPSHGTCNSRKLVEKEFQRRS
jgi:glyoxylase-like metal-dependent hydrolase (beta-lactamase superfamily II)